MISWVLLGSSDSFQDNFLRANKLQGYSGARLLVHFYIKLAFCLALLVDTMCQASESRRCLELAACFSDDSDSAILLFLEFH